MNKKWIFCMVLLAISLAGNIWLGATLQVYVYNSKQGWFSYSDEVIPIYPIHGLSLAELGQILDQIDATTQEHLEDKYVRGLEFLEQNTIKVITGRTNGILNGRGLIFLFNRKPDGWKLDEKHSSKWIS
jgi:hypothetical protein